jgi:hypothetical protein
VFDLLGWAMSWKKIRKWKHVVTPVAVVAAIVLMRQFPERSVAWCAGLIIAGLSGLAYIIEEVVWIWHGRGRPCAKCGHRLNLRSFSVQNICPVCGEPL